MKKLCIEGWRGINHSYALVNQWQILQMLAYPLEIYHRDKPYWGKQWNPETNSSGFPPTAAAAVAAVPEPPSGVRCDAIYRISFPFDLAPGHADRVFVFGTAEKRAIRDFFFGPDGTSDAPKRDNLFIVTPSHWSKAGFEEAGFYAERIHVVSHGVDPDSFFPLDRHERAVVRKAMGIEEEDFVLLSLGAMTPNKGIDALLVAYAILHQRYPHLKLVLKDQSALYGIKAETTLQDVLERPGNKPLFTEAAMAGIRFYASNLDMAGLRKLYCSADCYVSPYRAEGFNMPPLEAAACGTPIVLTRGGSTDDYFHPSMGLQVDAEWIRFDVGNQSGYVLEPALDSLVASVQEVIENQGRFGGVQVSQHVHRNFSWQQCTRQLLQVMDLLAGGRER